MPDVREMILAHRLQRVRSDVGEAGGLDHGFHPVGRETRYTIGPAVKQEILDRLLELNHARHAEEVAAGLHPDPKKPTPTTQDGLF